MAMPTYLTDIGVIGHLYRAMTDKLDTRRAYYGQPTSTVNQALLRAIGINIYPIDPQSTRTANLIRMRGEILSQKARLKQQLKACHLTKNNNDERKELVEYHTNRIRELQAEMAEYASKSKLSDKLKTRKRSD